MDYQWYPGHMTKAKRQMQEDIKLIDLVIELVDARVPLSSRNPDIDDLGKNKARLILLNKSDLADDAQNEKWIEYFKAKGYHALKINSKNKSGIKEINNVVNEACKEKIERDRKRGIKNRPVRAMVVGIPNVGKSTFINAYAGRNCAKTGNKPGVTKGKQWIKLSKTLELLDTPGILWPKFEDQAIGLKLALIGSINDNILDVSDMAYEFVKILNNSYENAIPNRFGVEKNDDPLKMLEGIAEVRGCKLKGNVLDLEKAPSSVKELNSFIMEFNVDERQGVKKLVAKAQKMLEKYELELQRTYKMGEFERKYSDYEFICGIDEVGRGPLAGPVVAGAVILPKDCDILYLNDSKQLSAKKREELYEEIMEKAVAAKTAMVSPAQIDEINILQATYEAMRTAISQLEVKPTLLLNDAVNIPGVDIKQIGIIKGDAKSKSIAAASIIAKVTRDAMMVEYDKLYPEYDFASNKGYGSAKHIEAIKKFGPCPIHRETFITNFVK